MQWDVASAQRYRQIQAFPEQVILQAMCIGVSLKARVETVSGKYGRRQFTLKLNSVKPVAIVDIRAVSIEAKREANYSKKLLQSEAFSPSAYQTIDNYTSGISQHHTACDTFVFFS